MKKIHLIIAGVITFGVMAGGAAVVAATTDGPDRPAWINADGKTDYSKLPDNAKIPYVCWNGKNVTVDGKTFKHKMQNHPMPGSAEHELGMAKSKELAQIPGVMTTDGQGRQTYNIDDTKPAVQAVMKKYEAKETPQCQ